MIPNAPVGETPPAAPASVPSSRTWLRRLGSVKLGTVLMLLIAAASILGTIVPQGDASQIANLPSSEATKRFLLAIRAYDVFYSPWFLALLGAFFVNLWISTQTMVIPRLIVGLRKPPELPVEAQLAHHDDPILLPEQPLESVAVALKKAGYRLYPASNGGLVAHKGRWSRFSPLVTHVGLFVILIGALITGLTTFKASVPLLPGETLPAAQLVSEIASPRGLLARRHYDWSVRLDKFWMDYYSQDQVKQFYSELSIVKGDKVVAHKTIWVNEPLVYDGVWFYQSFWGLGAIDLVVGGQARRVKLRPAEPMGLKGSLSHLEKVGQGQYLFYLNEPRGALYVLRWQSQGARPEQLAALEPGAAMTLEGQSLRYQAPVLYSGLQSKSDPGIPVVYAGFLVVVIGTSLAFFGLRQVWVGPQKQGYVLSGKANRAPLAFRQELARVAASLGVQVDV